LAAEVTSDGGFLDSGGRVFLNVLASGQHQFDGFHLHFLRDFGEGSHVFSSHFSAAVAKSVTALE
jgi:hypothetical protein